MDDDKALSNDAKAIVASNLVSTVALLRANRWSEEDAKRFALKLYDDFRAAIEGAECV